MLAVISYHRFRGACCHHFKVVFVHYLDIGVSNLLHSVSNKLTNFLPKLD